MESFNTNLWVFGYGSLCWHPGFETTRQQIGFVRNYVRRFWQGNTTHRGLPGKPGRVATLVREEHGITWGVAYEVTGDRTLQYLNDREVTLGGYSTEISTFYPKDPHAQSFPVLLYLATPCSKDWAGPAPLPEIASQIIHSSGPTGHNVEYLLRLAEFMKDNAPEGYDEHLAALENLVRGGIKGRPLGMKTLMGDKPAGWWEPEGAAIGLNPPLADVPEVEERRDTFQYSTQLPKKSLRCLNV